MIIFPFRSLGTIRLYHDKLHFFVILRKKTKLGNAILHCKTVPAGQDKKCRDKTKIVKQWYIKYHDLF